MKEEFIIKLYKFSVEETPHVVLFTLIKLAQDGKPDQKNSHWSMDGDGTVPVASVLALPVSAEGWPEALKSKLPTLLYGRAEYSIW